MKVINIEYVDILTEENLTSIYWSFCSSSILVFTRSKMVMIYKVTSYKSRSSKILVSFHQTSSQKLRQRRTQHATFLSKSLAGGGGDWGKEVDWEYCYLASYEYLFIRVHENLVQHSSNTISIVKIVSFKKNKILIMLQSIFCVNTLKKEIVQSVQEIL